MSIVYHGYYESSSQKNKKDSPLFILSFYFHALTGGGKLPGLFSLLLIIMQPTVKAGVQIECPVCHTKNDAILCVGISKVENIGVRRCLECGQVLYYTVEIICKLKDPVDMLREVKSENDLSY